MLPGRSGGDGERGGRKANASQLAANARAERAKRKADKEAAQERDVQMLVVLQPSLSERRAMTPIETDLFRRVEERFGSIQHLREAHQALRRGLQLIHANLGVQVLDASQLFEDEPETTFTDMWHFADPGHALLADALAAELIPLLLAEDAARE